MSEMIMTCYLWQRIMAIPFLPFLDSYQCFATNRSSAYPDFVLYQTCSVCYGTEVCVDLLGDKQ